MTPEPFQVNVDESVLQDLRRRLQRTRFASLLGDDSWRLGVGAGYLQELVAYWLIEFDWRRAEAALNEFAHFKANVGGARLHFIHQLGSSTRVPLLLLHGWPDSFYRYYKVIPRLTAPANYGGDPASGCDVVVPSLPGFGFTGAVPHAASEQPTRQSAELLFRLMTEVLGYRRFGVVGGDGGSVLAQILAIDHPDAVIGIHLTDVGWHTAGVDPAKLSKEEQKYLEVGKKQFMADGAYAMVHSSKPQSLAPALCDSPAGLAAWIVDRFHSWCDDPDRLERSFSKDELLVNIMIYWVTQTIGSSISTYWADVRSPSLTAADKVGVPAALALFPRDIGGIPPRAFAERTLNVQRWTEMPRGSHLAALEEPERYADDVSAFFRALGSVRVPERDHVHPSL